MSWRDLGVTLVPLCLGLVLGSACSGGSELPPAPRARVVRGTIERIVIATGTIEPEKEVEVRPRISGIIEQVFVEVGELVEEGAPLVAIDGELLEAKLKESRSRLEGSGVELHYAKRELRRARALREGGAMAEQALEKAAARVEIANAAVSRDTAAVESLEVQLSYTRVEAPMAGKILAVDVEPGDAVSSVTAVTGGTRMLTIAAADVLHLKGLVDENEIARVAVGQAARVRTEAFGERIFEGRVREISPIGDREENVTYFEVEILILDPNAGQLRTRMSADADIVTEVIEGTLLIPETALLYEGGDILVELVNGDSSEPRERRKVKIGIVDSGRVQILEGLSETDEALLR